MHIVGVKGNVKKGCDVELGAKTLVVGPNGSGKSTIVNTVELALTGRASDIAGRVDVAREVDVMSLAQNGAKELEALATFDDGVVAAYRTSGSTAKAKKATGDKPSDRCHADVLPIRSLREAVLGSPQTARKYLLAKASGDLTLDDVRSLVPSHLRETLEKVLGTLPRDILPADALVAALEAAGAGARSLTAEAKAAKGAAALVTGGANAPPTDSEIKAAKKAASEAQKRLVEVMAAQQAFDGMGRTAERLETARAEAERLIALFQERQTQLDALEKPSDNDANLARVSSVCELSIDAGECLVCGGALVGPIRANHEAIAEYRKQSAAARAAYAEAESLANKARAAAERAIGDVEALEASAADAEKVVDGDRDPLESVEEARKAQEAAAAHLTELQTRAAAWQTAQTAQKTALDAERQAGEWAELKGALDLAMGALLVKALESFVARVQANLPVGDVFDLRLRDGEREVVQFGLVRGGHLHTALSGAEWARVMAALAAACVTEGQYACVIPEERAFDPATLCEVMTALGESPHQVILTSPVGPTSVPSGWTVIQRG
jgi:energy-coupling factor transporter ATP-binding protein EcfA2